MQIISDASLYSLTQQLADLLIKKQQRMVTAESCTGGWVAKVCTDLPGSSDWFERGFVTYSNEAKQTDLNVSIASLIEFGAVSQQVAEEMAAGALSRSMAHHSVALTGIAGPGGGTTAKPVGTVWIAWASKQGVYSQCFHFDGDRESVRRQAISAAISGIIKNARDS